MLPINLLKAAQNQGILVELKNGDTYNGTLVNCDTYMNINLSNVILTSHDGTSFYELEECYIRGSTIKYLRIDSKLIDSVKNEQQQYQSGKSRASGADHGQHTSGHHPRGRGRGGGGAARARGRGGRGRGA